MFKRKKNTYAHKTDLMPIRPVRSYAGSYGKVLCVGLMRRSYARVLCDSQNHSPILRTLWLTSMKNAAPQWGKCRPEVLCAVLCSLMRALQTHHIQNLPLLWGDGPIYRPPCPCEAFLPPASGSYAEALCP